ncbi:LuxR family two component transcriptional regulator [Gelidibacter sediminis]|uniref:LuxR family two component transcriptional regulator n=1 Tax=Gelidibacter sediminis TaxID=1608710 RepID=A0A4R7Q8A5_9FLAO|nr:response regulator transcription factor [Gelidibacter sediminis]TDU43222.1 LuxR family two component transcriptional regulator [Gelidibacter sediminis]
MQASIIIADDHPLILKGLTDFLVEKQYNLTGSAANGKEAFEMIQSQRPDIAILDIQMPYLTGLEIAQKCQDLNLTTKIVLITFEKDESIYAQAKTLEIYGYVLKEFALEEIENCIAAVLKGRAYFSPELIEYLEIDEAPKELTTLTPTEKEVLRLIAKNKTAKEIGNILFTSSRTVEKHKSHIIKKLNLESKAGSLALYAKENESYLIKNT